MLTYELIYSRRDSIDKIVLENAKDISSIDIIKVGELAAQIRINIITYNDVYLPVTDDCYLEIFENGSYQMSDFNLRLLNYTDRLSRTNLINKLITQIMSCIDTDTKN
jgi:hypothetical protein